MLPVPAARGGRRAGGRGLRWSGAPIILAGMLLLILAAGDALAGAELGGGGDNALRGSPEGDRIAGFNGDDTLHGAAGGDTIYGGAGRDTIYGGPDKDVVLAGAGEDFVEVKDATTDRVTCGPGADSVSVDSKDLVAPDCETVYAG